ncbi:hypothetical protein AB0C52_06625 [Streptomyces sp. NPDC048717]|uniref:hypothetical protein n=1 Tax=unclassified Streptomyces TaxID=2593676 RepID=UPI00341656AF
MVRETHELAAVELPRIGTLTQRQQRGQDCVWCGVTLSAGAVVDLGPRRLRIGDWTPQWFPRACLRHPEGPAREG